jgi:5,10-methylenetetrahydromethanopterin reductase
MRIGLGAQSSTIGKAVDEAKRAADDGFASFWFSNIFGLDAITACAVVGHAVDGIELGTSVVPTYPRHPHAMAQQAATAQDACGGRFVLGIGLSHQVVIESMFGLSFDKPAKHMREYLSVLMPLLRDGAVSFKGEIYTVNAPLERPAGAPPVLVAALAPVMLRLAGALTDGTITWMTGPRTIADHIAPSIREAAAAAGRAEPRIVVNLPVCVTDEPDAARERAGATFAVYGGLPSYRAMLDREGAAGPADVAIVGDEATVAAGIAQMAEAGATDFGAAVFGSAEEMSRTRALLQSQL